MRIVVNRMTDEEVTEHVQTHIRPEFQIKGGRWLDGSDWEAGVFLQLKEGPYMVEIEDNSHCLRCTKSGKYAIYVSDDGGLVSLKEIGGGS